MLRLALALTLALGSTAALADKDAKEARKEALKAAREASKDKRDAAKEAAKDKREAAKDAREDQREAAKDAREDKREALKDAREERREDAKEAREDVRRARVGKALSVEAENEKHADRMARLARMEERLKTGNPALLEQVAAMRAKEVKRHERALARLAKGGVK